MKISVISTSDNIVFESKCKFAKEFMDGILFPILNSGADLQEMVAKSGYTVRAITGWFKANFGMTPAEYYKKQKQEALKQEFTQLYQKGYSLKKVADNYGKDVKWVNKNNTKFGLTLKRVEFKKKLDENVPRLINEGYSVDAIADYLGCAYNSVGRWIKRNIKEGIIKYRHNNNITLVHKKNTKHNDLRDKMKAYLDEGKNVKEVMALLNMSAPKFYYYKKKFNLKTKMDIAHELMDKYLPDMIKADWDVSRMSKVIKLSKITIERKIKELTGFNYKDIHNII